MKVIFLDIDGVLNNMNTRETFEDFIFVSDDKISTVGTVNMDYRSFVFHFECGVWICDSKTVMDVKEHFYELLLKCKEIKLEEWKKRPIRQRLKQAILHIFAPLM